MKQRDRSRAKNKASKKRAARGPSKDPVLLRPRPAPQARRAPRAAASEVATADSAPTAGPATPQVHAGSERFAAPPHRPGDTSVVFYFQVHQPFRLRHFTFFDIGAGGGWFDDAENERIARRVAERCYVPMNRILLEHVREHRGRFRCAFSISGTALEQMERWAPQALEGFVELAATGCVEFLCETSHHALASEIDPLEFEEQVRQQARRVEELFGVRPTTFRNTELVISEAIARQVEDMGFEVLLGEGADHLLGWRSARRVYRPSGCRSLKLLLRDYVLSDDIAFRFSNREWPEWPLTAARFAQKLHEAGREDSFIGLFMDYETFGEHQWAETGILEFMRQLPRAVLATPGVDFATPREVGARHAPVAQLAIPRSVSWADAERDLTAWLGNPMQSAAHQALYEFAARVRALEGVHGAALRENWRKLATSDHFYYMCTKWFSDGDVHKYFSPYSTPHDAFISFMNVLDDVEGRLAAAERAGSQAPARASMAAELAQDGNEAAQGSPRRVPQRKKVPGARKPATRKRASQDKGAPARRSKTR